MYVFMILMSCFLELNSTHSSFNPYINPLLSSFEDTMLLS